MAAPFTPWPCTELSSYPIDADWNDEFPTTHMTMLQYERHIGTLRFLFDSPSLKQTRAQLKDYCFCQGMLTNANALDIEFFHSVLSHDFPFFKGHLNVEIQNCFPVERKDYPGIGVLKASHFDFWTVESTPILGFARLSSMTRDMELVAYTSLDATPQRGDIIFGRLIPIGFLPRAMSWRIVEPFDTVSPKHQTKVLSTFQSQYDAFCQKFPNTSKAAFLKIAAYHIYESIQSLELTDIINGSLSAFGERLYARTFRFTFDDPAQMPDIATLPGALVVTDDKKLVTVPLTDNGLINETLRDAIVSHEGATLEVTTFIQHASDKFMRDAFEPLLDGISVIRQDVELDDNSMYRALRHLSFS